jgi:hypothetical protein
MGLNRASEVPPGSQVVPGEPIGHLEALAERLRAEGWYARIVVDGRAALLRVVNPAAPPLNDDLALRRDPAGLWWFHWSFGERISHVDNVDIAATRITRVLGCTSP